MDELRRYDSEIQPHERVVLGRGVHVVLGDAMNGIVADGNLRTMSEVVPWLQDAIRAHFPDSDYAKGLKTGQPLP